MIGAAQNDPARLGALNTGQRRELAAKLIERANSGQCGDRSTDIETLLFTSGRS